MPADTPKYGGAKIDALKAAEKLENVQPVVEEIKEKVKAKEADARASEAEAAAEERVSGPTATGGQVGGRRKVTSTIAEQTKAIEANERILGLENQAVSANTDLWLANARARKAAAGILVTPSSPPAPAAAAQRAEKQALTTFALPQGEVKLNPKQLGILASEDIFQGIAGPAKGQIQAFKQLQKLGLIEEFKGLGYGLTQTGEQLRPKVVAGAAPATTPVTQTAYQAALAAQKVAEADEKMAASSSARAQAEEAAAERSIAAREAVAGVAPAGGGGGAGRLPPTTAGFAGEPPPEEPRKPLLLTERVGSTYRPPGRSLGVPQTTLVRPEGPFLAGPQGVEKLNPEVLSGEQEAAIAKANSLAATTTTGTQAQLSANRAVRQATAEYAAYSSALTRHGALSTEFISALARGEVTLREFGNATVATIGKFSGWAVAGGLVYGAYEALKRITEGAKAASSGVTQLERAGLPNFSRKEAEEGFLRVSRELNVPIGGKEGVSEAQFYATRAGFRNQAESLDVARTGLEAQKLDQVPIQDSARAFGALHVAFNLSAVGIKKIFDELDVGQLRFNARLNQTLPQLGRSAAAVANAGGDIHELAQQLITVTGATGGGGGVGGGNPATFFLREPGNIRRPTAQATLRELVPDIFKRELDEPNITRFNKEIAQRAGRLTPGSRQSLAEAIGGGTAIGGRYAITLVNAGLTGRLRAVEEQAPTGHTVEHDLNRQLARFDEQVAKIGHTLERLGVEIGKVGLTTVAEDVVGLFGLMGGALEHIVAPLSRVGELFNELPTAVQQTLVALTGLSLATRINRSDKVLGLSKPLSEVAPAGLSSLIFGSDKQYLLGAQRVFSEQQGHIRKNIERINPRYVEAAQAESEVATRYRPIQEKFSHYQAQGGQFFGTEEGKAFLTRYEAAKIEYEAAVAQRANAEALLKREVARKVQFSRLEAVGKDKGQSRAERRRALEAEGVAPVLAGTGVVGPGILSFEQQELAKQRGRAPAGTQFARDAERAAAAQAAALGVSGAELDAALKKAAVATEESAVGLAAAGGLGAAAVAAAEEKEAVVIDKGAVEVGSSLAILRDQILKGAAEVGASFFTFSDALFGRGPGFKAGAGEAGGGFSKILGGIPGIGGALTGSLTKANLFKGLNYALFGTLGAELVGSAVGGGVGKGISNVGGLAAAGAGIGALGGNPFTIGAGALIGGGIGLAKTLFGGGHHDKAVDPIRDAEKQVAASQEKTIKGLVSGGPEALEAAAEEFGDSLEQAFGDDAKAAQIAQKNIEKSLNISAANLKLFPGYTKRGKAVTNDLLAQLTATVGQVAKDPKALDQSAAILEKIEGSIYGPAEAQFNEALQYAKTPQQASQALTNLQKSLAGVPAALKKENDDTDSKLKDAFAKRDKIREELGAGGTEAAHVRGRQPIRPEPGEKQITLKDLEAQDPRKQPYPQFNEEGKSFKEEDRQKEIQRYEREKKALEKQEKESAHGAKDVISAQKDIAAKERKLSEVQRRREAEQGHLKVLEAQPRPAGAAGYQHDQKIAHTTDRVAEYVSQEKHLQAEIRDAQNKKTHLLNQLKAGHLTPTHEKQLRAALKATEKEIENLTGIAHILKELGPQLYAKLQALLGEASKLKVIEQIKTLSQGAEETDVAEAGPDPLAKARVKEHYRDKARHEYEKKHGKVPLEQSRKERQEDIGKREEEDSRGAEVLQEHERSALAHAHTPAQEAAVKTKYAKEKLNRLLALGPKRTTPHDIAEARNEVSDAEKGAAEGVEKDAENLTSALGARQQALDAGNAVKQAKDAAATAAKEVAEAKTPGERIAAETNLINAHNQAKEAAGKHIDLIEQTRESYTADPLKHADQKVRADKEKLKAHAYVGPEGKQELQNQKRNDIRAAKEAHISDEEEEVSFLERTHRISQDEGLRKLQHILARLKRIGASKAQIRAVEEQIQTSQEQGDRDFAVGNIAFAPTLYDAKTLSRVRTPVPTHALPSGGPLVIGQRDQPTTHGHPAHHARPHIAQHNNIHINISGGHPGQFAAEMERVFGSLTRSQLRSLGLT